MFANPRNKEKVFCIGLNKTGTTTLEKVLQDFGYTLGDQPQAELLAKHWFERDFKKIISYCKTADAFQDIPFSLPYTYVILDQYFRNSKFILTVRDNEEQWYHSLVKFHSKLWAKEGAVPTTDDLKKAPYRYQGWAHEVINYMFGTPASDPYRKEDVLRYYVHHNYTVQEYFRSRPDKLLVINVGSDTDYGRLCNFLGKTSMHDGFPWENKTSDI